MLEATNNGGYELTVKQVATPIMSPAQIQIPPSQRSTFEEILKLTDGAFEALIECLVDGHVDSELEDLIAQTSDKLKPHTKLGGNILSALLGLRMLVDRSALDPAKVASDVAADAVTREWIPPDSKEVLKTRVERMLATHKVQIAAKAYSLATADAAPFIETRIITDIRPIFSDGEKGLGLSGSVIIHQLKIEVDGYEANQHSALSTSDLLKLKRVVDRAVEKDRRLRDSIKGSALTALESLGSPTQ